MTTLIQKLKTDQLAARKSKDAVTASLLTTLIGEAAMIGKNDGNRESTDAEVTGVIRKFVKNIDETLKVKPSDELLVEKAILETYMPKQLTERELEAAVAGIVTTLEDVSVKQIGVVMNQLNEMYGGRYNGRAAIDIVRSQLS